MIHAEEIQSVPRNFMPEVFTLEAWDGLKPFVEDLEQRSVENEQDFRQWLADRNEVTVVFEDIARWIHPVEARPGLWADHRPQVRGLLEYIKDYRHREVSKR